MNVSVAVVAYNEEKTLPQLLNDLVAQDYPHNKIEILLIDSMSKDHTREIMMAFCEDNHDFSAIRVLENPGKLIPRGHNVALAHYSGDALVRVDAHVSLSPDFISLSVKGLLDGEDVCGGIVESVSAQKGSFAQTLLLAENSVFCGGAAGFRRLTQKDYVNTLAFALYRREVFDAVGGYHPHLPRSEDNDMNYRVRQAGYRLCCDPTIHSVRYCRSSFGKLLKQKYLNGYWIGKTMGVNPKCFSLYHFVPFAFVLGILFTTILAMFGFPLLAMLMWGSYLLVDLGVSLMECVKNGFRATNLLLPILFLLLHLSYGIGTLIGFCVLPFWLKRIKSW